MDLSSVLPDDLAEKVKEAAVLSMGTEISEIDILNIRNLCDQVRTNRGAGGVGWRGDRGGSPSPEKGKNEKF